jgi:hypothetical protein
MSFGRIFDNVVLFGVILACVLCALSRDKYDANIYVVCNHSVCEEAMLTLVFVCVCLFACRLRIAREVDGGNDFAWA